MNKCDKCNKNLLKKSARLECSRCEKVVHCTTLCSGLTNKQLTSLRATENLEWTCQECYQTSPRRRSFIVPGDEEEDEDEKTMSSQINCKQLVNDISKEVEKAIHKELKSITESLQFHSDKLDEVVESMEAFKETIQELKRKNNDLSNRNKHLETRVAALEQHTRENEQGNLHKFVEITNIPFVENENVMNLVDKVADKLNLPMDEVKEVKRMAGRKEQARPILVQLREEEMQTKWIVASKTQKIILSDILPKLPKSTHEQSIFVREALTPYNKQLLWNTKQELKNTYKYIWCKKGVIRVRKEGQNEKSFIIRNLDDAIKLKS